jgi:PKD repeat protein
MRILGSSALLGTLVAFALAGCGGSEAPQGETPKPTTAATTAPTGQPTTPTTAPAGAQANDEDDEDLAAPLLVWADSDTDEGKAPLTIQFKADVEGGTPPLTYAWKFGDGTPDASEANPKHTFAKAGKYRVDLEVKDNAGDQDSDYLEIEVTE